MAWSPWVSYGWLSPLLFSAWFFPLDLLVVLKGQGRIACLAPRVCPCPAFNRGSFEPWDALEACGRYLVDPASSHMLVLKTKPCMSKYKYYTAKLRMAH